MSSTDDLRGDEEGGEEPIDESVLPPGPRRSTYTPPVPKQPLPPTTAGDALADVVAANLASVTDAANVIYQLDDIAPSMPMDATIEQLAAPEPNARILPKDAPVAEPTPADATVETVPVADAAAMPSPNASAVPADLPPPPEFDAPSVTFTEAPVAPAASEPEPFDLGQVPNEPEPAVTFDLDADPSEPAGVPDVEISEPQQLEPEHVVPEQVVPENFEPEIVEPETFEPEIVEPEAFEPEDVEAQPFEPQAFEPEAWEPVAWEPEAPDDFGVSDETTTGANEVVADSEIDEETTTHSTEPSTGFEVDETTTTRTPEAVFEAPAVDPATPSEPVDQAALLAASAAPSGQRPWVPERQSLRDDELAALVESGADHPGGTLGMMEELERQVQLREDEKREFSDWQTSMLAVGTPEALAAVDKVLPEFQDIVPPVTQALPVLSPAPPVFDAPPPAFDAPVSDAPPPVFEPPAPIFDAPASIFDAPPPTLAPTPIFDAPPPAFDAPVSDAPPPAFDAPVSDAPPPAFDAPVSDAPPPMFDEPFAAAPEPTDPPGSEFQAADNSFADEFAEPEAAPSFDERDFDTPPPASDSPVADSPQFAFDDLLNDAPLATDPPATERQETESAFAGGADEGFSAPAFVERNFDDLPAAGATVFDAPPPPFDSPVSDAPPPTSEPAPAPIGEIPDFAEPAAAAPPPPLVEPPGIPDAWEIPEDHTTGSDVDPIFIEPVPVDATPAEALPQALVEPSQFGDEPFVDRVFTGSIPVTTGSVSIAPQEFDVEGDDAVDPTDQVPASFDDLLGPARGTAPVEPILSPRIPEDEVVLGEAQQLERPRVFSLEAAGLEPTAKEQRVGRASRMFWMWFAANSSVVGIAFGAVLFSLGLSLRQAIVGILAGVAVSFLPLGLATFASNRSGQPTMVVSRAAFGVVGNSVPSLVAFLSRVFWGAAMLWLLAKGVSEILVGAEITGGIDASLLTIIALAAGVVVALLVALFGYGLLAKFQLVVSIVSAILVIGVIALTYQYVDISVALTNPDGSWLLAGTVAVLVFSFVGLLWANSAGDLARYQRPDASVAGSMLWTTFGAAVPTFLLISYGALLAASNTQIAEGLLTLPFDTIGRLLPTWYPVPLIAAVALSLLSGVIVTTYSGGFALKAVGVSLSRPVAVVVTAVLVAGGAFLLTTVSTDLTMLFRDLATTIAVPVAAWAGIFAADVMIRNRRYHADSLLRSGGIYPTVNWINLSAFLLITALGFGLTTATVAGLAWQGFLWPILGVGLDSALAGTDLGVFAALLLGLIVPIVSGIPGIRRQEAATPVQN